jgi:hypothetical protein
MCDYSLWGLPTRLAADGEQLVVHRFPTGSMGLASTADLKSLKEATEPEPAPGIWGRIQRFFQSDPQPQVPPAVCIPPGSVLIMRNISTAIRQRYRVQAEEGVVFVQTSANPNSHRDAVQFTNGRHALLQEFHEGVEAEVLSVSGNMLPVPEERELAGASPYRNPLR